MQNLKQPAFTTLLLMISFASVNAVMFTPALPDIAQYFRISSSAAQLTLTWFLVGYTLGQLFYGPIANRFGRKPALYLGICIQIVSSISCVIAGYIHLYPLLIAGRFFLALGSGAGLKMTYTIVSETYEPRIASQKLAYLMLAFAVTPALSVAIGGVLSTHFGWISCFYAGAVYGVILLYLVTGLPETKTALEYNAFRIGHLLQAYSAQFSNLRLLCGGLIMGCATSFVYIFAALAPFVAMNLLSMNPAKYGFANLLPVTGLIGGSLCCARLARSIELEKIIRAGVLTSLFGVILMLTAVSCGLAALYSLFLPMIVIYFGLSLIVSNVSTLVMSQVNDKAHASAVMNFINMGTATVFVLSLGLMHAGSMTMPLIYLLLAGVLLLLIYRI